MTAVTEVSTDVCEVSKVGTEDKCGLDMSSYQDLNKVKVGAADCNGSSITKRVDGDENGNGNANGNGGGKDDSDDSYVFVGPEVTADPTDGDVSVIPKSNSFLVSNDDVDVDAKEVNLDNGASLVETNCIVHETGETVESSVLESNCIVNETGNGDVYLEGSPEESTREGLVTERIEADEEINGSVNVEAEPHDHLDNGVKVDDQIEPECTPNLIDAVEELNGTVNVEAESHDHLNSGVNGIVGLKVDDQIEPECTPTIIDAVEGLKGTVNVEDESHEHLNSGAKVEDQIEPESTPNSVESATDSGESPESLIMSAEADDVMVKSEEENSLDQTLELGEISTSQNEILEDESTEVGIGEVKADEQPELHLEAEVEESSESFTMCTKSVEFEEIKIVEMEEELKSEEQPKLDLNGQVQESSESLIDTKSVEFEERKVEEMEEEDIEIVDEIKESQILVTDNFQSDLNLENESADLGGGTEAPSETETDPSSSEHKASLMEEGDDETALLSNETEAPLEAETGSKLILSENEALQVEDQGNGTAPLANETEEPSVTESTSDLNSRESKASEMEEGCNEAEQLAIEAKAPSETNAANCPISPENKTSQTEEVDISIDESQTVFQLSESSENARILPYVERVKSESENGELPAENDGSSLPDPDDGVIVEQEVGEGASLITENVPAFSTEETDFGPEIQNLDGENSESGLGCSPDDAESDMAVKNGPVGGDTILTFPAEYVRSETVIEFGSIGSHEKASLSRGHDVNMVQKVPNGDTQPARGTNEADSDLHLDDSHSNKSDPDVRLVPVVEHSSVVSSRDMPNGDAMEPISEILDPFVSSTESVPNSVTEIADGENVNCPETEDMEGIHSDGVPTSSVEGSVSDAIDGQNEEAEVPPRPFNFLIRIPRFDDESLREEIRNAQLQVEEKTQLRDAIRVDIQTKRANCHAHSESFEAAKAEETAARRLIKLKRQEIDSVQTLISRVKNAISVEDIDGRIYNMEHMIQHETLPLKEEKQFIRDIKQLKHLREQLSPNMGSQDEVQQALDQKDHIEERLKNLRKELESLKDKVSKAEAAAIAAGKKYNDENRRQKELQAQFRVADDVRQEAYIHFLSLKRQLYDKSKNFRTYKDDVMGARDFASRGDKESLHRLCVNQVETLMELWNTDDEFRKEYIRCNMSTGRRFRTLDGRALGPDEEPPVLPNYADERADRRLVSIPGQAKSISLVSTAEQEIPVSSVGDKQAGGKATEEVVGKKKQLPKTEETSKHNLVSGSATVSGRDEPVEVCKEEEKMQKREEQELVRKLEELRKEETAAKLKEQRRLEEIAKAKEALERKKRNAERAQMRAELRAQKEAELREKEREKRFRKKEKKKASPGDADDGNSKGKDALASESSPEIEPEVVKESRGSTSKRPQKPIHFVGKQSKAKPIPPNLMNKNKKKMQQYLKYGLAIICLIAMFFLGNTAFYHNLRPQKAAGSF